MRDRHPNDPGVPDAEWKRILDLVRRTVRAGLRPSEQDQADDLAGVVLVRVLRAVEREPARNLEALAVHISQKACADYIRRCMRQARLRKALELEPREEFSSLGWPGGDDADRLRFLALEFWEGTPCGELARVFFSGMSWKDWSAQVGRSPEAVRQEWARCVKKLKRAAGSHELFDW